MVPAVGRQSLTPLARLACMDRGFSYVSLVGRETEPSVSIEAASGVSGCSVGVTRQEAITSAAGSG